MELPYHPNAVQKGVTDADLPPGLTRDLHPLRLPPPPLPMETPTIEVLRAVPDLPGFRNAYATA